MSQNQPEADKLRGITKSYAPFSIEQREKLAEFQNCGWVHPFTCCGIKMTPLIDGMTCELCKRVQTWVWPEMLEGAPANPWDTLALSRVIDQIKEKE